jgi:nitroreductase
VYYAAIHVSQYPLPSPTIAQRGRGNLPMDLATVNKLLTTTRTVRKRLDFTRSVAPEIIQTCLEIAIQAPTGGNIPRYHFVVVTDETKRTNLAALYKRAYLEVYSPQRQEEVRRSDPRLIDSATYLAEHMHEVPVLIIPCVEAPQVQGTGPGASPVKVSPH